MAKSFTFKTTLLKSEKMRKNLKYIAGFMDNGKITSVTWIKADGSTTSRAVKSIKGRCQMNVKGSHLLVKDTNAREFKGDSIQYRKINLLTVKRIKQGARQLYL